MLFQIFALAGSDDAPFLNYGAYSKWGQLGALLTSRSLALTIFKAKESKADEPLCHKWHQKTHFGAFRTTQM